MVFVFLQSNHQCQRCRSSYILFCIFLRFLLQDGVDSRDTHWLHGAFFRPNLVFFDFLFSFLCDILARRLSFFCFDHTFHRLLQRHLHSICMDWIFKIHFILLHYLLGSSLLPLHFFCWPYNFINMAIYSRPICSFVLGPNPPTLYPFPHYYLSSLMRLFPFHICLRHFHRCRVWALTHHTLLFKLF